MCSSDLGIIWSAPLVCWRKWVEEDKARATAFVKAWTEGYRWLRKPENLKKVIKKYGTLAAVKNEAQAKTYEKWFTQGKMLIVDWDEATRDKQWEFLHMAKKHGILKKIPNKEKYGLILK